MLANRSAMKVNKEITHPAHPHHKLRLEYTEIPFDCHGCKEAGIGLKYRCQQCKYELHKVCGAAQPTITHPFYKKCAFNFYYRPPDNNLRICDACHGNISGFVYHCDCCDFDLHPCCVNLPQVLNDGQNNTLYLSAGLSRPCHHCRAKGPGWAYRSGQSKGYNLHVTCVKKLLVESWLASYFNVDKNKVQELQTRIPSLSGAPQRNSSGVRKYCQMAGGAARLVMSALLGDPTAVVAAVVQGLISM